jgi:hypothetical protein
MTCHFAQDPLQGVSLRRTYSQGSSATEALWCIRRQNMSKSCAGARDVKGGPCLYIAAG